MATNWTTVTFGEVVTLAQGLCFNAKTNHLMAETGIPLLRIGDLINDTQTKFVDATKVPKKYIANPQDIIFTRTGQVGLVFKGKVGVVHNNCFRVIPQRGIEPNYIYWYLRQSSVIEKARSLASGAAQPDLGHDAFKSIQFTYPELNVQQRIAGILSAYDELIENSQRRIKILETMARTLYREWFVLFRFPGYENHPLVASAMGEIPQGWGVKPIQHFGVVVTGKTPSKANANFFGEDVPFVKTPDMHGNMFLLSVNERLSIAGAKSQVNKTLPVGSICVSCIGTIGVVSMTTEDCQTNQQINSVVLTTSAAREFLFFRLQDAKQALENLGSNGATMGNVNKGKFESMEIVSPSSEILVKFHKLVQPMFLEILALSRQIQNLRRTRDLLLPRLLSGQIEVEAA